jgi:hypothetical protein
MMTEHDGLPVHGYRPQGEAPVAMVNNNKLLEEHVLRVLDELKTMPFVDPRWLATGRTDIEKGFMSVNRAIFQPARVSLPSDAQQLDRDHEATE